MQQLLQKCNKYFSYSEFCESLFKFPLNTPKNAKNATNTPKNATNTPKNATNTSHILNDMNLGPSFY